MTHFFLDDTKWSLEITIGDVKRVKKIVGIDLLQPMPMTKPISNDFNKWLTSGGFKFDELTTKQELFLRAIYSDTDPSEASLLQQLQTDICLLIDVIYALVKPMAEGKGLSDEQFGMKIGGADLPQIVDAFWGAYEHFFHQSGNRPLAKMIGLYRRMIKKAMDTAAEVVDEQEIERQMTDLITEAASEMQSEPGEESTHGKKSTNVQDTSE